MKLTEAVEAVKDYLMGRTTDFIITLDNDFADADLWGNWLIAEACGERYAAPLAGDLLWYHIANIQVSGTGNQLVFHMTYYDSAAEDAAAVAAANTYAASWGIGSMTEADAIKTIYLQLARLCTYDSSSRIGSGYARNSIYDVFVEHKSVCQGFANAMYYMVNQFVTPCRNIQGHELYDLGLFNHMWNIARIGTVWYYIDLTAAVHAHDNDPAIDDNNLSQWLMKNGHDLCGHATDYLPLPNYERSEWRMNYPITTASYPY